MTVGPWPDPKVHTRGVDVCRSEAVTAPIRVEDLARLERLATQRGLDRGLLVARAVDGLLASDDLAGGYVGPGRRPVSPGRTTETITELVRSDHVRRLDALAARRGVSRADLLGQAIDAFLAQEALIGAFGVAETAAWFAPAPDASIWARVRSGTSGGGRRGTRWRRGRRPSGSAGSG